jgi:tetratricopeptide (TPR) repeat protein/O-antigen ligase
VKALSWRLLGKAEGQTGAVAASPDGVLMPPRPIPVWAARILSAEPVLAPLCASILLLAPNPLIWPAALLGIVPSAVRLVTTGRPWRATAFDVPFVLLAIGALLGAYASLSREGAVVRLTGLWASVLLFAALREHAGGERTVRRIVLGSLAGATLATVLLLVLVGPFLLLERVPPLAAIVATVDRAQLGAWFVDQDWLLQRYRFRASGVGALAVVGLALAFAALVGPRGRLPRLLTALSIPLFLLTLVVADNRGSMLAAALTLGLMATVWRRRLLILVPVVAAIALLVVAFGPNDRGLNMRTLAQRFWFWENSVYLAREVPLTGAGLGLESVQLVYRGYFLPSYPPFSHAHSIYLQGLLEFGAVGLLGLIGLALATLWVGWRASLSRDRWTAVGFLAGYGVAVAMFTTGLTEIVMHSTLGGVIAIGALGLLAATVGTDLTPNHFPARRGEEPSPTYHGAPTSPRPQPSHPQARGPSAARDPRVRGRGSSLHAPLRSGLGVRYLAAACLLILMAGLAINGAGGSIGARLLLNAGTADLNRATFSETIGRQERSAALDRAVELLRLAGSLDPDDAVIQRNLALALAANDEARQARTAADRAKALLAAPGQDSNKAELLQLGRAYVAISSWGEAIRAWQDADAAPQLIQLGNRLIRLRNFDQAINAFVATARVDPASRGAYEGVTRAAHERKATTDEAIAALGPLLETDAPTELGARLQAARVLREAGRLRDAVQQLNRAEQISAPPELSFEYGRVWMTAGVPAGAEPLLVRAAADLPYEPDSWLWYARALAALGRHEEAVAAIRQGLSRLDPSGQFAPPAERLPETAAVRAVEIRRSERAPLLGVLAESLIRLGRTDEAISALDEAVTAAPRDAWLAATQQEALAVRAGAAPNLLFNPGFDREGSWSIRARRWVVDDHGRMSILPNETPSIGDGQVRFAPITPDATVFVQDVFGLKPGHRYRLSVRLRAEGLGEGATMAFMTTAPAVEESEWVARSGETAQWHTVTIDAEPGVDPSRHLTIGIGFVAGTRPGAVLWCDEATLVDVTEAR